MNNDLWDEMKSIHSITEYHNWMLTKIDEIKEKNEIKEYRENKGIYKKFKEESIPLACFANYYSSYNHQEIYIKHCLESSQRQIQTESYDAEVISKDGNFTFDIQCLEVTSPMNGESEKIRMCQLDKYGHVPAMGNYLLDPKKPKGQQKYIPSIAHCLSEIIVQLEKSILDIIEQKKRKEYPSQTALIVYYDDVNSLKDEFFEKFKENISLHLSSNLGKFEAIFIIHWDLKKCFHVKK